MLNIADNEQIENTVCEDSSINYEADMDIKEDENMRCVYLKFNFEATDIEDTDIEEEENMGCIDSALNYEADMHIEEDENIKCIDSMLNVVGYFEKEVIN